MTAIRVMTWNVHSTFHLNPGFDVDAVISVITKWSPDIVALQEIDSRGRRRDIFGAINAAIGGHSVDAKSIVTSDGEYGQMLVSRWPWQSRPAIEDISYPEREPRRAICANVETSKGPIRVVATHLGLAIRERGVQTRKLLHLAGDRQLPTILLGDFNDWFWINSVRRRLSQHFSVRTRHRTFPSLWPLMQLDRIYVSGGSIAYSATDAENRQLSDHLPVIADIAIPPV